VNPSPEHHRSSRIGWLRAAVLGANDGIVSTSSLVLGVAAADATIYSVVVAGVAGMVAGAMSMAAGEYVSVSSQADIERADLAMEAHELAVHAEAELEELVNIYEARGVERPVAEQVAAQLTAHDALAAHARDELGIVPAHRSRPVQAAWASAASFAAGGVVPLIVLAIVPRAMLIPSVALATLALLAALGAIAARTGGANAARGALRVTFWGALAMAATAAVGRLFGVLV
jgi:VIT1/CCC1 family predicted Fe2+/Mn2+ transporter